MTTARTAHARGRVASQFDPDWRCVAVFITMTVAFACAIAFPDTIPQALIWVGVIASAAFVSPGISVVLSIYGLALSIAGGFVAGNANTQIFWVRMGAYALIGLLTVLLSIQRFRREEALLDRATTDELTGLATRRLLVERLEAQMEVRDREGVPAVFYADLDFFKQVNDSHGHAAGDEVLRRASERLLACTRTADTLARFGGDEFVIACPTVDGLDGATAICERIIEAFRPPFHVGSVEVTVGITLGAALGSTAAIQGPAVLIDAADDALIACKQASRGTYKIVNI